MATKLIDEYVLLERFFDKKHEKIKSNEMKKKNPGAMSFFQMTMKKNIET